jgi:tetratricopeptide (TPR) repeat protein
VDSAARYYCQSINQFTAAGFDSTEAGGLARKTDGKAHEITLASGALWTYGNEQPRACGKAGYTFQNLGRPAQALPYYERAIRLHQAQDNLDGLIWAQGLMAYAFQNQDYGQRTGQTYEHMLATARRYRQRDPQLGTNGLASTLPRYQRLLLRQKRYAKLSSLVAETRAALAETRRSLAADSVASLSYSLQEAKLALTTTEIALSQHQPAAAATSLTEARQLQANFWRRNRAPVTEIGEYFRNQAKRWVMQAWLGSSRARAKRWCRPTCAAPTPPSTRWAAWPAPRSPASSWPPTPRSWASPP